MAITDPKDMQKAQKPKARTGTGQATRVPTHEGSNLGTPKAAGETVSKTPHVGT